MTLVLLCVAVLLSLPHATHAADVTITHQNSSLKFTIDDPVFNQNLPNDPVQLPRKVEWTVDGRRILVYPSSPLNFVDISHIHAGLHVDANQLHAQGPMLGYGQTPGTGTVTGGVVYTVTGGAANSGSSRITERVEIHNKTSAAVPVLLAGMGFKPPQAALEVPDFSGITVTGTTLTFYQGTAQAQTFTDPPYPPLTVLPVVSFTGFNPLLNQNLNLPAGAVLTMVTELKVERNPWVIVVVWWLIATLVLAAGAGAMAWRRRSKR